MFNVRESINPYEDDAPYLATDYLLRLIFDKGLGIQHLYRVEHIGTSSYHIVVALRDGRIVCDCQMQVNLSIPCRNYFALMRVNNLIYFHLGYINARYVKVSTSSLRQN